MKKITRYEDFNLSESVVGKFTTVSQEDIKLVKQATVADFGDEDTPKRKAILNALEAAYNYFEQKQGEDTDTRTKLVAVSGQGDEQKKKLLDLAKTFVNSLDKIARIESNEIEPVSDQISALIDGK